MKCQNLFSEKKNQSVDSIFFFYPSMLSVNCILSPNVKNSTKLLAKATLKFLS